LAGVNLYTETLIGIAKLDFQHIAFDDDGYAMVRVAVPSHGLAGVESQTTDRGRPVAKEFFV
jgi:hypothetical protein